jgi:gliding motility-associated-like protein
VLFPNIKFDITTGQVRVDPQTKSGSYTFNYIICEVLNLGNCATNSVTINVTAAVIDAVADVNAAPINGTNGGAAGINVLANDTLNGTAVNPADVVLTSIPNGPLTVNTDGTVTVAPNTAAGIYTVDYTICEKLNPTNCDTATVSVTVQAPGGAPILVVYAENDAANNINGLNGATNILNVLSNDLLGTNQISLAQVNLATLSADATGNLILNADGSIDVKSGTPAGTYSLVYEICEKASPSNCDSATVTVSVYRESVSIVKSAVFNDENGDGYAQIGETISYHFAVANTGSVSLSNVSVTDNLQGLVMTGSPIAVLGAGETNNTAYSASYVITQSDLSSGAVFNQATVSYTDSNDQLVLNASNSSVTTPLEEKPVVEIFNAISPNGDGDNDFFYIGGVESFPENSLEIFNRWGVLVFERNSYNNIDSPFKGISEGRVTVNQNDELPAGTYYYVFKYKDLNKNQQEKVGYLYINR